MTISLSTEVKISRSVFDLTNQTPIITVGSCFSDQVGGLLSKYKFNIFQNPFGVLYNPLSIAQALKLALYKQMLKEDNLIFHNSLWHSFYFHGSFSHSSAHHVLENTNRAINEVHNYLKTAEFLFVTFGTAWVYRYVNTNQVVSNCHKLPANEFQRFRLTVEEIIEEWEELCRELKQFNPHLKIIFTVSPVRHFKDGAHQNQLSKSILFIAIDKIIANNNHIDYFPSYEIVNDELRDYRFYADDMLHVAEKAIQIVFEKFKTCYFNTKTIEYLNDIQSIIRAVEHRVLNVNKDETKKFAKTTIKKIETLEQKYPFVNFMLEKIHFENL